VQAVHGEIADKRGNPAEAAEAYARALAGRPNDVALLDARALALSKAGQHAEALKTIDEAIAQVPPNSRLEHHAGLILAAADDPQRALESMDKAISLDPENWGCLFDLAQLLEKTGKKQNAFQCYDEILEAVDQNKLAKSDMTEAALVRYRAIREEIEAARSSGGGLKKLLGGLFGKK
jgi:tetratricopeptide (TPR) repeat protein